MSQTEFRGKNVDMQDLLYQMNALRVKLYNALDAAKGNQLDARVQKVSEKFDAVLNQYMRSKYKSDGS